MAAHRYTRPDGHYATHIGSLIVTVWSSGEVTASLSSREPGGDRLRHVRLPVLRPEGQVAPVVLEGLILAADAALEQWATGQLG